MFRYSGCILGLLALCTTLQVTEGSRCLTEYKENVPKLVVRDEKMVLDIKFELSRRVTQRLVTRITKIFLVEVMGYTDVTLIERDDKFDNFEVFEIMSQNLDNEQSVPDTMVNMETWIPSQVDTTPYLDNSHVKECGVLGPAGYFGWFVPRELWRSNMTETWHLFASRDSASQFDVDEAILAQIKKNTLRPGSKTKHICTEKSCQGGIFVPEQCQNSTSCAMLLSSDPDVTEFVINDIRRLNLYVKVAWVGSALRSLSQMILDLYRTSGTQKSLVILHWTPSSVIPNDRDFVSIGFPRCRDPEGGCKYDNNNLVKVVWARLELLASTAYKAIKHVHFTGDQYEDLLSRYNKAITRITPSGEEALACDWLRENLNYTLQYWKPSRRYKKTLTIGGIFPSSGESYKDKSIFIAANMAKAAINHNDTVLGDYDLVIVNSDGQCKADKVMKAFIDYLIRSHTEPLVGILGPACSETIEPLIGVSKEYNTMVISYSAEGAIFNEEEKPSYFFRTIGENIHFEHVYLSLLQKMNWRRVAALTEDGQKYTEYISHMWFHLETNGITFVDNAKYPRNRENNLMYRNLENLKKKRARIIIADVEDEVARQVMCNASRLNMTGYEGYVWFLPLWLLPGWWDTDFHNKEHNESIPCTSLEMMRAVNGYLGISHAYYAPDDAIMQENITVREWRNRYELECKKQRKSPSDYAGYAYDATWTYAYAMDQLLIENEGFLPQIQTPSTAERLTEIISQTDFQGVSGRIKFLSGGSRISLVEIVQHVNNETKTIGVFHPNVSEITNQVIGGKLDINTSALVWLTEDGRIPDDGTEEELKCVFASLAEQLDITCEVAIVIVNIIGFGCLGILLIGGFIIVKRKYDEKVRLHEKYMKSLGIDLLQTDTSGLDKWEIPRECVVINRKLGEGAFGTVYGGEALFAEKGWLAVAVKTLKVGSSTEEKLDFLSEVEVMKRFEHKNIIKLLGVCIKCEPVYTVMEFMLYGDLKTYLLARRHLVNDRNYEDYDEISSKKLTTMALDVARALSYLAQLKYVHRDIASRNCLVNAQRVVKLGDFGMTRPMYENDYYKFNRKGMLPVRWMAPESLGLGIFTPASDVWSYGVLLYEIITFGSFPFQGLSNNEVLEHVKTGNTITIPSGMKAPLENLIRSCWMIDRKYRPKAPEIVDFLATNPKILSPCLDVPLASVQLEHTGQIEMQLPEKFRKFSISLPKTNQQLSKLASFHNPCERSLMGNGGDVTCSKNSRFITARSYDSGPSGSAPESARPLIQSEFNDRQSKYVELQRNINNGRSDNEASSRYVNIQPGLLAVDDGGDISMDRRILVNDETDENQEAESSGNELSRISFL